MVEGGKRRRVMTFSSEEVLSECQHPAYVLCIHLPHDFGYACRRRRLPLFLRHLYFASTFHFPPFIPKRALLDSLSDDTPTCLAFPSTDLISLDAIGEYGTDVVEQQRLRYSEELWSLFHYFDCQQAMQRSEQVVLQGNLVIAHDAWVWLPVAVRHKMKAVEDVCIKKLGRDKKVGKRVNNPTFIGTLDRLSSATIARVMAAMSRRLRQALVVLRSTL